MLKQTFLSLLALICFAASASAQTPCHAEYGDNVFDDNVSMGGPNLLLGIRFVALQNMTVRSAQVFTGEGAGLNTIAIYSSNGSLTEPLTPLGSGTWNMSNSNSWQGASLNTPVTLIAATSYWLCWSPINGSQASVDTTPPGLGQLYNGSFNGGQSWFGPFSDNSHWKFRLFGDCSYCTAKTNSLGCMPVITATGTPSATSGSGYTISALLELNNKSGLLLYGLTGRAALPFQGGTLCVSAPIRRTSGTTSGGTPPPVSNCSGVFSIDMNKFAVGALGGNPAPALTVAGTQVDCQWWGRDPGFGAPNNTSLSDAYEYMIGP